MLSPLHALPRRLTRPSVLSRLRTAPRRLHSTRPPPHSSSGTNPNTNGGTTGWGRSIAIGAGLVGASGGVWWLTTRRKTADDDDDGGVPFLDTDKFQALLPPFSPDQVTSALSESAYSIPVRTVPGVARYDGAQVASNSPCEDRFVHGRFPSPRGDGREWMAWAVLDGHAGWQTADLLERELLPAVRRSLRSLSDDRDPDAVRAAVARAFVDLDDAIIGTADATARGPLPLQDKMRALAPGYAGSCALLALYDPATRTLYVACTGDSRAVLGRRRSPGPPGGHWEAVPLSVDQNGRNADEVARIAADHPGEDAIARNGRILGLAVSRAFGDGRWKWPLVMQEDLRLRFQGPRPLTPRYDVLTPPYLTAEPVVTATVIEPGTPAFLVLATDGLWDFVSSRQAVDLVAKWLDADAPRARAVVEDTTTSRPAPAPIDFGRLGKDVPETFVVERTTVQDDNAAVHLIRNALGGGDQQLIASRLAVGPPFSRNIRDDTTVQVVFFSGST